LIGSKLIFYTPLYLLAGVDDPYQYFPAVRKWHKGARPSEFHPIASATQIYRPEHPIDPDNGAALHTVTTCDLSKGDFDCTATAVIGPWGRVFYVSPNAVYVWVTEWKYWQRHATRSESMVYRMPLDGSSPSALHVSGSPVDQFSFLESEDGYLNALVRSDTSGDAMWGTEFTRGDVALMRVPLRSFSDGGDAVSDSSYHRLSRSDGDSFQNRFVGNYLLYGSGTGWWNPQKIGRSTLFAVPLAGGDPFELVLDHGTDRIEQMGSNAVVVGTDGTDLHFTAIRLGDWPEVMGDYVRKQASQGDLRSQGFFYKPDGQDSGMLGLPISVPASPGYMNLYRTSEAILFLKNDALHFQEAGELAAQSEQPKHDGCRVSCVDWYGNSRPLFVHGRIFALLGYELVEGNLNDSGRIRELRRVNYGPRSLMASR